jgi:hypothetical protein
MRFRVPKVVKGLLLAVALLSSGSVATAQSQNLLQAIPTPWGFDICGGACLGFYCCIVFEFPGG